MPALQKKSHQKQLSVKKISGFQFKRLFGFTSSSSFEKAERVASEIYGTGPGAVRFISGSLRIHRDLEKALALFINAMMRWFFFFIATNLAVLYCLIAGQNKDSLVDNNVIVISDALNHRSIIDGIRVANLPKEQRAIFRHMDPDNLETILEANKKFIKGL